MINKILIYLFCLLAIKNLIYCKEVCYDNLGCFTNEYPFSGTIARPIALLPQSPEHIGAFFTLYNKKITAGEIISAANLTGTHFNSALRTKFITHGFLGNGLNPWIIEMKEALLEIEDVNVIVVDWSKGAKLPYTQATANTQLVGAEIAFLINTLVTQLKIDPNNFHLIGHSLGAHTSGYAGKRIKGLGRISGLDPAGPYFENTDPKVRLSQTDANFVDAIHTDGSVAGLGLMEPVGTVDYYPNGGKSQPECRPVITGTNCNHFASIYFYIDSIKNNNICQFTAYQCDSEESFKNGLCLKCSSKGCNRMGYFSSPNKDLTTLYLNTKEAIKLQSCRQDYLINLYSSKSNGLTATKGKFTIFFETKNQTSSVETVEESGTFEPGSVLTRLISLENPLNQIYPIISAFIFFEKSSNIIDNLIYGSFWSFEYIEIFSGESQKLFKLCPVKTIIHSNELVQFNSC